MLIILLSFTTPEASKPKPAPLKEKLLQMDPLGVALVMGTVICYLLALHYGGNIHPWSSSKVIGLLVGFVLFMVTFLLWEWKAGEKAMIPFRLASQRVYLVATLFAFFFMGSYFLVIYYLPIYFQSVDNVSPEMSGVRNIPLILAVVIAVLASGGYISTTGIAAPVAVAGAALSLICMGLLYTFDLHTSEGKWIGYQVIGGLGWGGASQIPIITVQATAPSGDLAEVTAIVLFAQTIGGAFLVSAAQAAFVNILLRYLPQDAPNVNPLDVIATGATDLRRVFSQEEVAGILVSYMRGLKDAFAVGLASSALAFIIIAFFQKYNRLNTAAIAGGGAA